MWLQLRAYEYRRLDGGTDGEERTAMMTEFNEKGSDIFIFMLSTRAGGLGINLQTADTVILFDHDWNPAMDEQAKARVHRIGQKNQVLIIRMVTPDTVEERIVQRAGEKLSQTDLAIDAGLFNQRSTAAGVGHACAVIDNGVMLTRIQRVGSCCPRK